jgi:hypothetical protein
MLETQLEPLTKKELSSEIIKVKLSPPKNYEDSHSIANEWAIYRWASSIGASDEQITSIKQKIGSQLYFKYLSRRIQVINATIRHVLIFE